MKTKLLRKLRQKGRNQITIHSVTTTNGVVNGMSFGYSDNKYSGIFSFGDTKEQVLKKVENIYLQDNIDTIRKRYKRRSVKYKSK